MKVRSGDVGFHNDTELENGMTILMIAFAVVGLGIVALNMEGA